MVDSLRRLLVLVCALVSLFSVVGGSSSQPPSEYVFRTTGRFYADAGCQQSTTDFSISATFSNTGTYNLQCVSIGPNMWIQAYCVPANIAQQESSSYYAILFYNSAACQTSLVTGSSGEWDTTCKASTAGGAGFRYFKLEECIDETDYPSDHKKLSGGVIAGIVVGSVVVLCACVLFAFLLVRQAKRKRAANVVLSTPSSQPPQASVQREGYAPLNEPPIQMSSFHPQSQSQSQPGHPVQAQPYGLELSQIKPVVYAPVPMAQYVVGPPYAPSSSASGGWSSVEGVHNESPVEVAAIQVGVPGASMVDPGAPMQIVGITPTAARFCTQCGTPRLNPNGKFCAGCGVQQ